MRGRLASLSLVALCACASQGSAPPDVAALPSTTRVVSTTGGTLSVSGTQTNVGVAATVNAPPDSVFVALEKVYGDLGVKLTSIVTTERWLGNQDMKVRRRFAGVPLQNYLDCGNASGEPNAETYDVTMSLLSYVTPSADGGSMVTTRIDASGTDPNFGRGDSGRCMSSGDLESRIVKLVQQKLAKK